MDILFLLIPLSLVLVALVVWALLWAVRSGQFEDLEGPAHRILMDDDGPRRRGPDRGEPGQPSAGEASAGEPAAGDPARAESSRTSHGEGPRSGG